MAESTHATDIAWGAAIKQAAAGLDQSHREFREQAKQAMRPLLDYLRSERPIEAGERAELVDLLSGEYGKRRGRTRLPREEIDQRSRMCGQYRVLMDSMKQSMHGRPDQAFAIDMLARMFPYTPDQIRLIVRNGGVRKK